MPNSVEKAMLVLRELSDAGGAPVTLAALSERLALNKSTLAHILKTLAADRYVLRISHTAGYTLGPELYYLARQRFGEELVAVCHPLLRYLHRESGGTAVLAVMHRAHKYIIDNVDGVGYFKNQGEGARIVSDEIYRTVTGRILLSEMPEHEALAMFDELGAPAPAEWPEASDRTEFLAALEKIRREKTCARMTRFRGAGHIALAVPVHDGEKCVGAMGLSVPLSGDAGALEAERERLTRLLVRCRREAERRLKFG